MQFVGVPNADNGVRGMLELERATKLFKALSNDRQIAATLKYADGSSDLLQFSGFDECLRGLTPKPGPDWDIRVNAH